MVVRPDSRRLLIPLKSRLYLLNSAKSCLSPPILFTVLQRFLRNEKLQKKMLRKKNSQHSDSEEETMQNSRDGKKNKKRKRKQVTDLRFETTVDKLGGSSKRRERKKKYFEAKKKRHKNARTEENLDFPGRENIKFGDVVEAPPKLVTLPKGSKTLLDASKERLRLQAIEAYRNRKGWTSRPGAPQLPPVTT
ncbi:hypothetical protein CRYUN_Cryun23aG0146900 [Craigia yunnanensis]